MTRDEAIDATVTLVVHHGDDPKGAAASFVRYSLLAFLAVDLRGVLEARIRDAPTPEALAALERTAALIFSRDVVDAVHRNVLAHALRQARARLDAIREAR